MWLTNSSVGRKVVMSVTGLFLILFVTFHVLMNAVAIFWPCAYNAICEFLGANWYALIGTAVLAAGFVLHIIYAFWLTLQNRKARGNNAYEVSKRPKNVEWASQNMLVLGIIVVCFMGVHLIQFWAKMQLPEMLGEEVESGMVYVYEAFKCPWTLPIYLIGFAALWFHLTHGFWSAFQSLGTNNSNWEKRFKSIGCAWATVVCLLFAVEAVVFTLQANCPDCQAKMVQCDQAEPCHDGVCPEQPACHKQPACCKDAAACPEKPACCKENAECPKAEGCGECEAHEGCPNEQKAE